MNFRGCALSDLDLSRSLAGAFGLLEPVDSDQRFFEVDFSDFLIGCIDSLRCAAEEVTVTQRGSVTDETGLIGNT